MCFLYSVSIGLYFPPFYLF